MNLLRPRKRWEDVAKPLLPYLDKRVPPFLIMGQEQERSGTGSGGGYTASSGGALQLTGLESFDGMGCRDRFTSLSQRPMEGCGRLELGSESPTLPTPSTLEGQDALTSSNNEAEVEGDAAAGYPGEYNESKPLWQ